ncbi:hypothetical protein [Chryseobacterium sp. OSA05B]|uniref:hypothetical protein n=1 Tax=Chryseobacterium sp. OSA05B TaxID=2862650 RepID=UPI001CBDDCFF|nr:hypothetical protein [Chryseobacterium sp. OSA05B]
MIKKINKIFPKRKAISLLLRQSKLLSVSDVKHPVNIAVITTLITPVIKKIRHKIARIFITLINILLSTG